MREPAAMIRPAHHGVEVLSDWFGNGLEPTPAIEYGSAADV